MEKNMEENNLKGAGKTPGTADQAETPQTPHKRRVRYKGTHPRSYKEKYKELQPEKYGDTIAKVISKGSTPAGMHISIMVKEILDFLNIQPGRNFGIWWSYQPYVSLLKGRRPHICSGCGYH